MFAQDYDLGTDTRKSLWSVNCYITVTYSDGITTTSTEKNVTMKQSLIIFQIVFDTQCLDNFENVFPRY